MKEYIHKARVYVEDTDYGGIMHHSRYLILMEHARIEWQTSAGLSYDDLLDNEHHFIVRAAELEYIKPARLNKILEIHCEVVHTGKTSLHVKHIVRLEEDPAYICCEALIKLVCINNKFKPVAMPSYITEKLT